MDLVHTIGCAVCLVQALGPACLLNAFKLAQLGLCLIYQKQLHQQSIECPVAELLAYLGNGRKDSFLLKVLLLESSCPRSCSTGSREK